jgi:hypothetical protein
MAMAQLSAIRRRDFLKLAGAATVSSLTGVAPAASEGRVTIVIDPESPATSGGPVTWAVERVKQTITAKGVGCEIVPTAKRARGSAFSITVAAVASRLAREFAAGPEPKAQESFRLVPGRVGDVPAVLVSAADPRGFVYGLLELAERAQLDPHPVSALQVKEASEQRPANPIRCLSRYFVSEMEDKPWYDDRKFWPRYLDTLIASRFNRFCLAYGLAYDFPRGVTDDYLHLPYPYLVDVPGYRDVQVMQLRSAEGKPLAAPVPLSSEERNRNFEALKFIAAETAKRGLDFQLGIWTHAYQWTASPDAYHHIDGLTPETHAEYCRDALALILKECPEIQGLTMRVHGESGIPEGSYSFWKTLFEAISGAGRTIEIDLHAKGVNQTMIDIAAAAGMPVTLGAKYSAEHQSLGYQQADIRALEIPNPNHHDDARLFSLSGGSRLFTRYGYGDFLEQGSHAKVLFRLWPGTERHLLSADPEMAAAFGRTSHFCGAVGIDLMEPLTFKGREGSGHAGGRCAYADVSLNPKADWEKFEYYYRVWGLKLYDPDSDLEGPRRYLTNAFGPGAIPMERALSNSSRILPLITSAHLPSASNHAFWPELYTNMPIVAGSERSPYSDTPDPKCFGTVSPLDPQLFSTIVEHTENLLDGRISPKYSPVEVAQWLEDFTRASNQALARARLQAAAPDRPEFRRMEEDIAIQNGLGAFFAAKLRSGVLYEIYQRTGDPQAGRLALAQYREARDAWAKMADRASRVYMADVSYGDVPMRRGHWTDRLLGIERDLSAMEQKVESPPGSTASAENAAQAIHAATVRPGRPQVLCAHTPPENFDSGRPLVLSLKVIGTPQAAEVTARLYYRHVDQAERWLSVEMSGDQDGFSATIPVDYTRSLYPLEYYFVLARQGESAWFHPGFNATLSNQPYFAISQKASQDHVL